MVGFCGWLLRGKSYFVGENMTKHVVSSDYLDGAGGLLAGKPHVLLGKGVFCRGKYDQEWSLFRTTYMCFC